MYDLERFIKAQEYDYSTALKELSNGRKESHYIWYIFPQLKGLGYSTYSEYYGLSGLEEAEAYYNHEVLGGRLLELCNILLSLKETSITQIMGYPDDLKLKSSMTIFYLATQNQIFKDVIDKYFNGEFCIRTMELIKQ